MKYFGVGTAISLLLVYYYGLETQTVCAEYQYESEDSNWIDPGDMISYDPVGKTSKKDVPVSQGPSKSPVKNEFAAKSSTASDFKCPECPKCEVSAEYENLLSPNYDSAIKSSSSHTLKLNHTQDKVFVKRFLSFYMKKLSYVEKPKDYMEYEVHVGMRKETWNMFQSFCDNSSKVAVQEILHELEETFLQVSISKSTRLERWKWRFEDYFHISSYEALVVLAIFSLTIACLTMEIFSKVSWMRQFSRLLIIMFLLSYFTTYVRMYQEVISKQRASHDQIPDYCKGLSDKSLVDEMAVYFRHWFSVTGDPCVKYHDAFNHPFFRVSPLKVFSATISEFILEPLEHFGRAFSRMLRGMFEELPIQLWIPAFIFIVLFMLAMLLLLSVCFGYTWNFRLPLWTGFEIAPGANVLQTRHHQEIIDNYKLQIQDLNQVIRTLQENRPAIQGRGDAESWGATFGRWLNLGENGDDPNGPPPPAVQDNPENLEPGPGMDFPLPQTDSDLGNGLRRRHTLPYPPANPPYPPGRDAAHPHHAASFSGSRNRFVEDVEPHLLHHHEKKHRAHSFYATTEPASGEPHLIQENLKPEDIGFKKHIMEGTGPVPPDYREVVKAAGDESDSLKSKPTETSPKKTSKSFSADSTYDEKPCCSKSLPSKQISQEERSIKVENDTTSRTCKASSSSVIQKNDDLSTLSTSQEDGKTTSSDKASSSEKQEKPSVPSNQGTESATLVQKDDSSSPPKGAKNDNEKDNFVFVEGPTD